MTDSFCAYRLPGDTEVKIFKGELQTGFRQGFIIAPFDLSVASIYTICNLKDADWSDLDNLIINDDESRYLYRIPRISTTKSQHRLEVESIINELKGDETKKTIAARTICRDDSINPSLTFDSLAHSLPDAFVFLFYTPISGAWIGASPELLLSAEEEKMHTYALAGTREAGSSGKWDDKNIKEQKIVRDYIVSYFNSYGLITQCSDTNTRNSGCVEHLITEISSDTPENFSEFLKGYSPTPALCGMPKEESLERIKRLEDFDRGFYGGFCGPCLSENADKLFLFVILRSLHFDRDHWCLYAGGGITCFSSPDDEWQETMRKASYIINLLKFKNN